MTRRGTVAGLLVLAAAAAAWFLFLRPRGGGEPAWVAEEPAAPIPAPPPAAPPEPSVVPPLPEPDPASYPPRRVPLRVVMSGKPKREYDPRLVAALRAYLDPDSPNSTLARTDLMTRIRDLWRAGTDLLDDVDGLQALVYRARAFDKPLDRKSLPRAWAVHADAGSGIVSVLSAEDGSFEASVRLPQAYPREANRVSATAPFPVLVTLHEFADTRDEHGFTPRPGEAVIRRRYLRPGAKQILDEWIVVAPLAHRGEFARFGRIESERVNLTRVWKSHPVDFDRFVLDGGSDALLWAASQPVWYAGVVVRGDAADVHPHLVRNFSHLFVYIVGTEASAAKKSLLAGGMEAERITVGDESGLAAWLSAKDGTGLPRVRRATPVAFDWIVTDPPAHRLAHWVNISDLDPAVDIPWMSVEVVDTAADPNTIRVTSEGMIALNFFLNDRILDLSRPVRVVANGKEIREGALVTSKPDPKVIALPTTIERNGDVLFDTNPTLSIKKSYYFGWLHPVNLTVRIAEPRPASGAILPGRMGTAEEELWAKQYFEKALENVRNGEVERAKRNLKKAIDVGQTSTKPKAEAELKKIEGQ